MEKNIPSPPPAAQPSHSHLSHLQEIFPWRKTSLLLLQLSPGIPTSVIHRRVFHGGKHPLSFSGSPGSVAVFGSPSSFVQEEKCWVWAQVCSCL